jgi:phage tail-like protein
MPPPTPAATPTPAVTPYYPPPAFAFCVSIVPGTGGTQQPKSDAAFQEVSGIDPHVTVEEVTEGGLNAYVHQLPGVTKHGNLVLKRGYMTLTSLFADWANQTVGSSLSTPIVTQIINVILISPKGQALITWTLDNAWPVKWEASGFNAKSNEVLIETMEISYGSVTRKVTPPTPPSTSAVTV